jgi:uncharacterized protein
VSDTHGQLRPEAVALLRGVDLVLHAGDVGREEVLEGLRAIAPVYVVRGNVDHGPWAERLPVELVLSLGEVQLYMVHQPEHVRLSGRFEEVTLVIHGHTHMPRREERDGVVYLNPGAAGPRRFGLPVTLALLEIEGSEVRIELRDLERGGVWQPR